MQRNLLVTALFAASTLLFSQVSFAEESAAFVARGVAMQQAAQSASADSVAKQGKESRSTNSQDS